MKKLTLIPLTAFLTFTLVSCVDPAGADEEDSGTYYEDPPIMDISIDIPDDSYNEPTPQPSEWSPRDVHLVCGDQDCSSDRGIVIFAQGIGASTVLERCSSAWISRAQISVDANCDSTRSITPDRAFFFDIEGGVTHFYQLRKRLYERPDSSGGHIKAIYSVDI